MASEVQEYSVDREIASFFTKTSQSRDTCDAVAKELVGGDQVVPVAVQGVCSYTVYAGQSQENVVQFRLKSLELRAETIALAKQVYGSFAPDSSCERQLGEDTALPGQEPLLVYVMARVKGISRLDFILAEEVEENALESKASRKTLTQDVARFFALAWNSPQQVDQAFQNSIAETYEDDLKTLLVALPERFQTVIRATLASLPEILSLPMAFLHKDFGDCNIIVDETSCHLVGVIDWAEAEIAPFGTNLHSIQGLMSKLHLEHGWIRHEDYDDLARSFWTTFSDEIGGLDEDTASAIEAARILGLLRSRGFTCRLADEPKPQPIQDNEDGAYNMMVLDGLLLEPSTRFGGVAERLT